jgi:urate oxidase
VTDEHARPGSNKPGPSSELGERWYAKCGLRVVDLRAELPSLAPVELVVDVAVHGGLDEAYLGQSNRDVLPSNSLRTAALACIQGCTVAGSGSLLARDVATTLLVSYPFLPSVAVRLRTCQLRLASRHGANAVYLRQRSVTTDSAVRVAHPGAGALTGQGSEHEERPREQGAFRRVGVVLYGRHRFEGFYNDGYSVRPGTGEYRVLVGTLSCRWQLVGSATGPDLPSSQIRRFLFDALARDSESVQHLLTSAGNRLLSSCPDMHSVQLKFRSAPVLPAGTTDSAGKLPVVVVERGPTAVTSVTVTRSGPGSWD